MKIRVRIREVVICFLAMTPYAASTQTLGPVAGNSVEISSVAGSTTNAFMNKQWLYRPINGNDWYSARLHDGISVDASFLTPHSNTRTWWERDPYFDVQSWGQGSNTYLTINQGNVAVGTTEISNSQGWDRVFQVHGNANAKLLVTENSGVKVGIFGHSGFTPKIGTESNHNITFMAGYWNDVMTLTTAGNVGIGTNSPNSRLSVNGNVRAKEVKVEAANWPDYVFSKDYELPSLKSIGQHIKVNGHLPGIPSAADVQANGINLGEMNVKLLQKIEELTLYLIDLKKENDGLKSQVAEIQKNLKFNKR